MVDTGTDPCAPALAAVAKPDKAADQPLGEFDRIARYFRPLAQGFPGAQGLRDDAAYVTVPPGKELVVTTDAMVAGVHFFPEDAPGLVAGKLLRTNLSDLAAKGAEPLAYSLVTSLPRTLPEDWLAGFAGGLAADQAEFGIHLLGGDSTVTDGPITLVISALGLIDAGTAVRRVGAGPGDLVFVTGTIGDATLGLALVRQRKGPVPEDDRQFLLDRFYRPRPRLGVGPVLRAGATASADVSDGLLADLGHIVRESGLVAVVEAGRIPLSPPARRMLAGHACTIADLATGGEDYEVVFTVPPAKRAAVMAAAAKAKLTITEIGSLRPLAAGGGFTDGTGPARLVDAMGRDITPRAAGWQHF
ncbi:thiamine-phosphate kinase [Nitrospirillum amazonense]|uniref:Thiamine-monophosphate kinase n=1 Tax=Nitrospirillum amazonense TaxID=28077 RepID=A0A560K9H3_9PROT|nr:thiamine-phosphate kinase [Nitrospirillum amazonense]TWB79978.1 thiamine-phosphate kinase [Nitrospirillum amazonense]